SSKPHGDDQSEPSTPSASPSKAAPSLAQLETVNDDLSNYPLWLQILADIFDSQLRVPRATELEALGAAMNAAIGVGYCDNHEQAAEQMLAIRREVEPNPQNRAIYAHGYDLFKSGYLNSCKIYRR